MAKKIKGKVKMRIKGGGANPAVVGASLGQHGIQLMDFCKKFNAETASRKDETVPVFVTVYVDKTFDFVTRTPPVSELILKCSGVKKGASNPGAEVAGSITWKSIEEIAKTKMVDLNAVDMDGAKKIVAGSAMSMGLKVID